MLARSGNRPRSLRGMGADHIVADEAAYLPKGLLGGGAVPHARHREEGDDHADLHAERVWGVPAVLRAGLLPGHWSRTAPTAENPRVSKSFLDLMRSQVPEATFAREYEGRFAGVEGGLFAFEAVRAAVGPIRWGTGRSSRGSTSRGRATGRRSVVLEGTQESARAVLVTAGAAWVGAAASEGRGRVGAVSGVTLRIDATGMGDPVVEWARRELPGLPIRSTVFTHDAKHAMMHGLASLGGAAAGAPRRPGALRRAAVVRRASSGRLEGRGSTTTWSAPWRLAAMDLPGEGGGAVMLGDERR